MINRDEVERHDTLRGITLPLELSHLGFLSGEGDRIPTQVPDLPGVI